MAIHSSILKLHKPVSLPKRYSILILYYSGVKEDDEDTLNCVRGIEESLIRLGHSVKKLSVHKKNWREATSQNAEIVFNLVEDDTWELYELVGKRLENLGRVQVGHNLSIFTYVVNKALVKVILEKKGIPTPKHVIVKSLNEVVQINGLLFPLIIKPSKQHAGIGISQHSVVTNKSNLLKQIKTVYQEFHGEVIIEEYIEGREIQVTIIGNGYDLMVFPFCEIGYFGKFKDNWSIYSYKAKWDKKSWEYWDARVKSPPKISSELESKITAISTQAYRAFDCVDITRFDLRIDKNNNPYIIDVNLNPSLNYYDEQDATTASIKAQGWTYDEFIETLLAVTLHRKNLY